MKKKEKNKANRGRIRSTLLKTAFWALTAAVLTVLVCNGVVIFSADKYVLDFSEAEKLENVDCIIVLGAGVNSDGSMSFVLTQRVKAGAELYKKGISPRLLVSGDHSREDYNEVGAMKNYMTENGIPASAVFTDHAGFDTYDTMYRARDVFKAKKVLIVTQDFHISRAVFIARSLGLDAYGCPCDGKGNFSSLNNELREIAARTKYAFIAITKPLPKYVGEAIPIWGEASASDG